MTTFDYDDLKITTPDTPLSVERWNGLVDQLNRVERTLDSFFQNGRMQILHKNQGPKEGVLILGPTDQSNLRLGYHSSYSWIQSHGGKPLMINPLGNNVGIGTDKPTEMLHVKGKVTADAFTGPNGARLITRKFRNASKEFSVRWVTGTRGHYTKASYLHFMSAMKS